MSGKVSERGVIFRQQMPLLGGYKAIRVDMRTKCKPSTTEATHEINAQRQPHMVEYQSFNARFEQHKTARPTGMQVSHKETSVKITTA